MDWSERINTKERWIYLDKNILQFTAEFLFLKLSFVFNTHGQNCVKYMQPKTDTIIMSAQLFLLPSAFIHTSQENHASNPQF